MMTELSRLLRHSLEDGVGIIIPTTQGINNLSKCYFTKKKQYPFVFSLFFSTKFLKGALPTLAIARFVLSFQQHKVLKI